MCQCILSICSNTMNLWVLEHVWVCVVVFISGESFHAGIRVYVSIMNGSAIICHTLTLILLLFNYVCMCTTLQMVSITAHISSDTFPIGTILQQVLDLFVLTMHCTAKENTQGVEGWGGWGEAHQC